MSASFVEAYEFGPFRLEPAERRLLRNGEDVSLPPKALDLLVALVSRSGRLVTKEVLLEEVWPGTFVEEANLSYTVSILRKALDEKNDQHYIDTVPKRGYRFKAGIERTTAVGADSQAGSVVDTPVVALAALAVPVAELANPPRASQWRYSAIGLVLLGLAAVSLMATLQRRVDDLPTLSHPARFDVTTPDHLRMGPFGGPRISPDGRWLVWGGSANGTGRLWVRRLDSASIQPLAGTEHGGNAFWSPDSRSIGFFADGKLKRVNVDGGPVLTLCDAPGNPRGAWGSHGVILLSMGGIYRVPDTAGIPQPVIGLDTSRSETQHVLIGFLSDGRRFLFRERARTGDFFLGSIDSPGGRQPITIGTPPDGVLDLAPTRGYLLYAKRGTIFAQSFDENRLESRGPPITLADGAWSGPSVSRTGVVVFRTRGYPSTQLTWRGRDGSLLGVVGAPDTYLAVELSPTGNRAAVVRAGPSMYELDLWLADLATGVFSSLTAYPGLESDPQWAPDERHLAFTSNQTGTWAPVIKDLSTGTEERLLEAQDNFVVDDWTNDGRFLLVRGMDRRAMYALPSSGQHTLQKLRETLPGQDQSQVSPDGTWVAFNTSDDPQVYVARFPGLTDRRQVSTAGGAQPRWRGDSRELYYVSQDGTMMAVEVTNDRELPFLPPRPLFKWLEEGEPIVYGSQYDVSADGKRFLVLEPKREPANVFTFLVNWSQALKK